MQGQQNSKYTLSITDSWSGTADTARCIINSAETKHDRLSQDSQNSNPRHPKHETEVLPTEPLCSKSYFKNQAMFNIINKTNNKHLKNLLAITITL